MSALKAIVVGIGANVWGMHVPGITAIGASVVAVQDANVAKAEAAAAELGCAPARSLDELLTYEADLAVVLTPHKTHAEIAIRCLEAGLHVLVEKPLAASVADADRMVRAAEESGRLLAVALQQRTRPEVQMARGMVDSGALGRLQRANLVSTWPRRASFFHTAPWRGTWAGEGGGVLINQGQHDLDLLYYLAGSPARLFARTRTRIHSVETEDSASASLEWADGALGSFYVSTASLDEIQRIELTGTHGRLRLSPGRLEFWNNQVDFREYVVSPGDPYAPPSVEAQPPFETTRRGDHEAIYRNLVSAIGGEARLVAPASEAVAAVELANAAVYSSHRRTEVDLPLDRAAFGTLMRQLQGQASATSGGTRDSDPAR